MEIFEQQNSPENAISRFDDLRGLDLTSRDLRSSSADVLTTTEFDTQTKWPNNEYLPEGFIPELLMEKGKNPGLGIRGLHMRGIDGRAIRVAIIDQKLLEGHREYRDAVVDYAEFASAQYEPPSMHGSAVTSLLVGKECGVAPGASLVYRATPSGRDFAYKAQALNDIVEANKTTAPDKRIRVVSCSIGYSKQNHDPGLDQWIEAIEKAEREGVVVVDTTKRLGIDFVGGGSSLDWDDVEAYREWLHIEGSGGTHDSIIIPSDYRTMASWKGENEYAYNGKGGLSWVCTVSCRIVCAIIAGQSETFTTRARRFGE